MLGAAHALWLLDVPERSERQRRALRLAHAEFTSERTALREIENISGVASNMTTNIDTVTEWINRAVTTGVGMGFEEKSITQRLEDTEIIDSVAKRYVQVTDPRNGLLINGYRVLWRTQSGIAHGYRWPQTFNGISVEDDTGEARIISETTDIAMAGAAAARLIQRAIELYEEGRKPTS